METNNKIPLIVFSGGVDSTYMLHAALLKGDVWTLYVNGAQGELKAKAEIEARKKILKWFADKHTAGDLKGQVLEDYVVKIETTGTVHRHYNTEPSYWGVMYDYDSRRTKFNQPLQWLAGINFVVNPLKISEIQLGYITGDQMALHLHDLTAAWGSLMEITHEDPVPLTFPLKYFNKRKIFGYIERELLDMTWVCEPTNHKGQPCQVCDKCREYELMYINTFKENPPKPIVVEEPEQYELQFGKCNFGSPEVDLPNQRIDELEEASTGC